MTKSQEKTRGTVFIVDDDLPLRRDFEEALTSEGYVTRGFAAGTDFLKNAENYPVPSVVLLDVLMPEMDGHEVHRELVKRGVCVPVVFLTAYGRVGEATAALKLGAVDYLEKPASLDDLTASLDAALEKDWTRSQRQELFSRYKSLTPREREVFIHSANGKLDKQTASAMGIALQTVKLHKQRVREKMGTDSIQGLTLMASDLGLISAEATDELGTTF
jgi:FixJ family two-component response regulator